MSLSGRGGGGGLTLPPFFPTFTGLSGDSELEMTSPRFFLKHTTVSFLPSFPAVSLPPSSLRKCVARIARRAARIGSDEAAVL